MIAAESVTKGHPDKICDQISDAVLDEVLTKDSNPENARVACECFCTTGAVVVGGEIRTDCYVDIESIARNVIREIGYTSSDMGFDADTCSVWNIVQKQSPDIAMGVDDKDTLVKIAALITDVDDMLESALDKDFFEKVEREAASMPVPKIDFEWKTIQFTFLSHQMEDLKKLCDKCASADWEGVADIAQFDRFVEALNQTKKFGDVKNIGSAIHFMTERTLKDFGEDGRDYRTAASVFGKGLIPQHVADKLEDKIKSLTEEGRINNPWEVFDILFDEEGDGDA